MPSSPPSKTLQPAPLDWSDFIDFQTPPIHTPHPASHAMHHTGSHDAEPDDHYQAAFAHGIALSRPPVSTIHLQQPQRAARPSPHAIPQPSQPQQSAYAPFYPALHHSSPHSSDMVLPGNKGKSPETSHSGSTQSNPVALPRTNSGSSSSGVPSQSSGLRFDSAAFPREIRFQVPSFLSSGISGIPTFPPGGEVLNGFSGSSVFALDGGPTPNGNYTSSYTGGPSWAQCAQSPGYCHSENDISDWSHGVKQHAPPVGMLGSSIPTGMGSQMGMVYVNPNPSPSIVGPRHQSVSSFPDNHYSRTPRDRNVSCSSGGRHGMLGNPDQNTGMHRGPGPPLPYGQTQPAPHSQSTHPTPFPRESHLSSGIMPTSDILPPPPSYAHSASAQHRPQPNDGSLHPGISTNAAFTPSQNPQPLMQGPLPPTITQQSIQDGPGLYSTTGFDMLGVLGRVAARKNPGMVLGPVDLSCSFVVVDIRRYDSPIVYASPSFTVLTGYELPQILGRNCRFLQNPDGNVPKGSKRVYTDNDAVASMKRTLDAGKECQTSLINYRRGGEPFINLVTVVPIPWDGPDIVYHVGFQIDLVEQPDRILKNMRDGNYSMDYTYSLPPERPLALEVQEAAASSGLGSEILDVMGGRAAGMNAHTTEESGRMEWLKMVLDNTDDFVHALSLKGFFQYCSTSVRKSLGYEPEDLLNKNIAEFAHPSDIVPLIRALKDSTLPTPDGQQAKPVNLTFRIRKKNAGFVWIECIGRLVVEAGKGRKAVILSGRVGSVPSLSWDTVRRYGGLAQKEFWGKISFQGLLLHLTSGIDHVLGHQVDQIIGHSLYSLFPRGENGPPSDAAVLGDPGSSAPATALANAIHQALHGHTVSLSQKMVHRSGDEIDVLLILYAPSQAEEEKPRAVLDSRGSTPAGTPSASAPTTESIRPANIIIQVKVVSPMSPLSASQATIASLTNALPVVHPAHENLFDELETTKDTSWQYELHRIKMANRKLKEEIAALRAKGAGRKRKRTSGLDGGERTESEFAVGDALQMTRFGMGGFH